MNNKSHLPLKLTGLTITPVSYTHLDVYKRQDSELVQIGFEGDFQAISPLNLNGKVKIAFKGNDLKQSSVLLEWLNNDKSTLEADLEYNSKKMLIDNITVNGSGLTDLSGRVEYDTEIGNILNESVTIKKLDFDKHESDSLAKSHSCLLYTSRCV